MRDLGLTLAGGGNRSFYQQALLEEWGERLWPRVAALSCVSAGSAIAILLLAGRAGAARTHWDALRKGLTKNVDLGRVLSREPIAPHGAIYRSTILHALEEGGLAKLRETPFPVYVLCSVPPSGVPSTLSTWVGLLGYSIEKKLDPRLLHPRLGARLGFRAYAFDARACDSAAEVADLVLASSSTPPFTPLGSFRGLRLLDGGIVDNVPATLVEKEAAVRKNLVLLTRPYPRGVTGQRGSRLYIEPSAPVPIERWDYRESADVEAALALGRADARKYEHVLARWLGNGAAAAS